MKNNMLLGFWIVLIMADVFAELPAKQTNSNQPAAVPLISSANELLSQAVLKQPYVVELPTSGYGKDERKQDIMKALSFILVKNSNDPKVLGLAGVKAALANPGRYVQRFSYINRSAANGKQDLFIQVHFDPKALANFLQRSSKTVWIGTKPATLVWLAQDTAGGKVLDETSDDGIVDFLKRKAREVGLSIILPTLDLQDIGNIKVQDICRLDVKKINTASQRYGSAVIVVGCVSSPTIFKKEWSSKWLLLQGVKSDNFSFIGNSAEDVITQAMKTMVVNTANVVTPVVGQTARVVLRITRVDGLGQYNELVQYLRSLGQVTQIDLLNISATEVELAVNVLGGKQALLTILGAQNKLVPNTAGDMVSLPPGVDLDYKLVTLDNEKPQAVDTKPMP